MVGADITSAFDFQLLKPFRLAFKERFLFDWERKYTSVLLICNAPVNIFSTFLRFTSENMLKVNPPPPPKGGIKAGNNSPTAAVG